MATLAPLADQRAVSGAYRVDISKGRNIGRVSSEWFSRPDDERFLSLSALYDSVRARAERATTRIVESRAVRVEARSDGFNVSNKRNPHRVLGLINMGNRE